jgi:hypothetical protein
VADDCPEVSMTAHLDPQHTKARLVIVEGHPLYDADERFPFGLH